MNNMNAASADAKLTKGEKSWILYDVGNSAFTLMVSTIIPIYFHYLAGQADVSRDSYMAYWGYAISIATIISAVLGVVLGAMSDLKGYKKIIFTILVTGGSIGCALLGFAPAWILFLVIFIITRVFYADSLVLYDSMLPDVTTDERMDNVSSQGYAWGYIGSVIPFALCLVLYLVYEKIGLTFSTTMMFCFLITAVWWILMTVPLLGTYRQVHYVPRGGHPVSDSLRRLGKTFLQVRSRKHIFVFLIAFFFYIDGVYTIITMSVAYGESLGLDSTMLLLALLVTQFVAFPCSIIFGRLSGKVETVRLILVCILAYTAIAIYAIFLKTQIQFWILAICVGMFQGGIQSLSRSYYSRLIPPEESGEYFGLLDICGKGADALGPFLVAVITSATGHQNLGVGAISLLMVIGFILMIYADKLTRKAQSQNDAQHPAN